MNATRVETKFIELMSRHYTVQCKCGQCSQKQAVKISELAAGQNHCRIVRLGQPRCNGTVDYVSEDLDESLRNATMLLGYLNLISIAGKSGPMAELLDTVVDDVGCWSERGSPPQEMGWVGQNGLP